MSKHIVLTRGYVAIVDDSDYNSLSHWSWHISCSKSGIVYAIRREGKKVIQMHRQILGVSGNPSLQVDHIDGIGLNNTRANLRWCTCSQNLHNRHDGNVGVHWTEDRCKWTARISVNNKRIFLGHFSSRDDAVRVRESYKRKMGLVVGAIGGNE